MFGFIAQMFGLATTKQVEGLLASVRAMRRLADERWQVAQERHDAVIELIAQIPECGCPSTKDRNPPTRPRRKAK